MMGSFDSRQGTKRDAQSEIEPGIEGNIDELLSSQHVLAINADAN